MMVNINIAYATCLWNQIFSSSGRNLILGRMYRSRFRHMGNKISNTSKERTSPAPRDIQTENVSVFSPASSMLDSWRYLVV